MSVSISVVVHGRHVASAASISVAALLRQTYHDVEVVLVVPRPSDECARLIESRFPDVTQIVTDDRLPDDPRNTGLSAASGEVVAFLDDNAAPTAVWLEQLAGAYTDRSVAAAGGFVRSEDGTRYDASYAVARRQDLSTREVFLPEQRYQLPGADPHLTLDGLNCSFRRTALDQVGGFRSLSAIELGTRELCRRIVDAGGRIVVVPDAFVQRVTPSQLALARALDGTIPLVSYRGATAVPAAELAATALAASGAPSRTIDVTNESRRPSRTFSRRRPTIVAHEATVTDDESIAAPSTPLRAGVNVHVLRTTLGEGSIQPRFDDVHGLIWVHRVAASDRWLPGVRDPHERATQLAEAALLLRLRGLADDPSAITLRDERQAPVWPLERLVASGSEELRDDLAVTLSRQLGLDRVDAQLAAEVLLDPRELGHPSRSRLARAATKQGREFVTELFALLLERPPTPTESVLYAPLAEDRNGRLQLLMNLATSSRWACQPDDIAWMVDLDSLEQDGLSARLAAALDLPPGPCVQELHRVLLGREASLVERLVGWLMLRADDVEPFARRLATSQKRRAAPHLDPDRAFGRLATSEAGAG